jgi:nucleoside-diphosphate-sugar epimerase
LFIDDAISAFVAAAVVHGAHSCAIPIGGGREYTVVELCREVMRAVGGEVPIEENAFPPRSTEIWRMCADNADAKRLLGWIPSIPLPDGLRRTFGRSESQGEERHARSVPAGGVA